MDSIIPAQISAYRDNFLAYGNTPQGTFQNNSTTQYERFRQLMKPLLRVHDGPFHVCDVGSGVSDLHRFLMDEGLAHRYTGIEIVPEMVQAARRLYPAATVRDEDFLNDAFTDRFDFCVLSGVFNLPGSVPPDRWREFVFAMVEKMYRQADIGIAFNALTTYSTFRAPELFYLDPGLMIDHIQRSISRHCIADMASPLYEVTYCIYTPRALRALHPQAEFDKYFR